jgi:F-type H+-transporting ATPase subunit b
VLIDWYTVFAQIINFLILVLLLRRFLYRPITNAMAERERKISKRLDEAARQRAMAATEMETYQQKNAAFEQERETLMGEAQARVATQRQAWLDQASSEVNKKRSHWQKALAEEKEAFLQTMRRRAGQQTYLVIRHTLADLADTELEEHMVQVFLDRLAALPEEDIASFREALQADGAVLTLNSAFEMDNQQRQGLRRAILAHFDANRPIQMQVMPDLICGLELVAPGQKIAWSLAGYLDELEEVLMAELTAAGSSNEAALAEGQKRG